MSEFSMTPEQTRVTRVVLVVVAASSVVCMIPVLVTFLAFHEKRSTVGGVLTMAFCVATVGIETFRLLPAFWGFERFLANRNLCVMQAVLTQFFSLFCVVTFCLIARNLHTLLVARARLQLRAARLQLLVGCGVCILLTGVPWGAGAFGRDGDLYCWYNDSVSANWQLLTFSLPTLASMIIGLTFWILSIAFIRASAAAADSQYSSLRTVRDRTNAEPLLGMRAKPDYKRHLAFVTVYMVVTGIVALNNVVYAVEKSKSHQTPARHFVFWLVDTVTVSGIGVAVALTVGLSRANLMLWRRALCGAGDSVVRSLPSVVVARDSQ
eukprot:a182756_17.p1 GENE.a182756_17~~a182756_17.p1  ORF type:complete len:348 (+),score=81.91 a182756_17:77-1045(+)